MLQNPGSAHKSKYIECGMITKLRSDSNNRCTRTPDVRNERLFGMFARSTLQPSRKIMYLEREHLVPEGIPRVQVLRGDEALHESVSREGGGVDSAGAQRHVAHPAAVKWAAPPGSPSYFSLRYSRETDRFGALDSLCIIVLLALSPRQVNLVYLLLSLLC